MAPVDTAADTPAPPPPEELVLAGEFPGATRDQWAALVDGVLRKSGRIGADAEPGAGVDKLVRRTPEGIPVAPLYTQADVADLPPVGVPGRPPYVRGGTTDGPAPDGWDVRQRHEGPDVREAILADLENGVTSVWLATGDGVGAGRASSTACCSTSPPSRSTPAGPTPAPRPRTSTWRAGSPTRPPCWAPSGSTRSGCGPAPASARTSPRSCRWRSGWRREHPLVRAIVVDGLPVHAAGGVRRARSSASRWRPAWRTCGRSPTPGSTSTTAARLLEFRYAATDEQFPTIAKLRAARRLWARVLEACGAADARGPAPARRHRRRRCSPGATPG